ncbi:MAG: NAD(P)H-dependent oxidoreductase subunit E [Candidatus Eremiobacteraeota bacterium]|nr:NAD(P)H-dependent oxidoreductase subunit E [Candidatus Eremiobacteraeota bacterium]
MDAHFTDAQPTDAERGAVDTLLGVPQSRWEGGARTKADAQVALGGHTARNRRDQLLPALHAVNDRVGWISEGALNYICRRLTVPPADAYGVASFYGLFSTTPRPHRIIHVCDDLSCMAAGAEKNCAELEQRKQWPAGKPSQSGKTTWLRSPCLGQCDRAPAALLSIAGDTPHLEPITKVDNGTTIAELMTELERTQPQTRVHAPAVVLPQHPDPGLRLLRRIAHVTPTSLEDYRAAGGYAALRRAIGLGPAGVIGELTASKLMGRGGAAFPTGRKWEAVASEPARPHYLVCNADESEPGTFKDRILMEEDPFALVESMTIAALAGGCELGYIYIRGEYPLARERLMDAIGQARDAGLLGSRILGSALNFDIELRRGAGAYICGEETALFNSLEGLRGEPRNKPPFPVQRGLFGKPTIVNNVETLVNVLDIVIRGGAEFAKTGTPGSTGTKLFCVSGHVTRPGLYEVPFGITLRALLEVAGGVRAGRPLKAVLLGGAAGTFVSPDELDTPLSFEGVRAIGATIGSGVVIAFDESTDLGAVLRRIAAFFRDESCGQCVPCRVGTVRQEELLSRLATGAARGSVKSERELLADIGQVMRDASICGLGQTASSAIESALRKFEVF